MDKVNKATRIRTTQAPDTTCLREGYDERKDLNTEIK
jgi:hypothetical protein